LLAFLRKLRARAGYPGAFLALLGCYDVFFGIYLYAGAAILHSLLLPERTWGIIWIITGAFLFTGVPVRHDRFQFAVAVFIKAAWALEYLRLALITSLPYQWARAAYWLCFALLVLIVSAWPEPERTGIIDPASSDAIIARARKGTRE
jgi:hypothetical protein